MYMANTQTLACLGLSEPALVMHTAQAPNVYMDCCTLICLVAVEYWSFELCVACRSAGIGRVTL